MTKAPGVEAPKKRAPLAPDSSSFGNWIRHSLGMSIYPAKMSDNLLPFPIRTGIPAYDTEQLRKHLIASQLWHLLELNEVPVGVDKSRWFVPWQTPIPTDVVKKVFLRGQAPLLKKNIYNSELSEVALLHVWACLKNMKAPTNTPEARRTAFLTIIQAVEADLGKRYWYVGKIG